MEAPQHRVILALPLSLNSLSAGRMAQGMHGVLSSRSRNAPIYCTMISNFHKVHRPNPVASEICISRSTHPNIERRSLACQANNEGYIEPGLQELKALTDMPTFKPSGFLTR